MQGPVDPRQSFALDPVRALYIFMTANSIPQPTKPWILLCSSACPF